METLLVSVLIPVKNTSSFLIECLDSILCQKYKNWEVLAVDDGSTDTSWELLNQYASKDKRVKVFRNSGAGIIEALRMAYSKSSGHLITRMDSDDIMSENKLSVLVTNLVSKGQGNIAVGLVKYFSADGLGEGFKNYETWLNGLTISGNNFKEIYKECVIPSPCWMVFREDFERCGALIPNRYPEDYDLAYRFYINGLRPIPCDKVLHFWRDYATRTSRTDDNYADNTFIEIKTYYFLKQEYDDAKSLVLWGAGRKGKALARILLDRGIDFEWICDNPKKIGKHIYGKQMLAFHELDNMVKPQSIVTVANTAAKKEIATYFQEKGQQSMQDYFFFC